MYVIMTCTFSRELHAAWGRYPFTGGDLPDSIAVNDAHHIMRRI